MKGDGPRARQPSGAHEAWRQQDHLLHGPRETCALVFDEFVKCSWMMKYLLFLEVIIDEFDTKSMALQAVLPERHQAQSTPTKTFVGLSNAGFFKVDPRAKGVRRPHESIHFDCQCHSTEASHSNRLWILRSSNTRRRRTRASRSQPPLTRAILSWAPSSAVSLSLMPRLSRYAR